MCVPTGYYAGYDVIKAKRRSCLVEPGRCLQLAGLLGLLGSIVTTLYTLLGTGLLSYKLGVFSRADMRAVLVSIDLGKFGPQQ